MVTLSTNRLMTQRTEKRCIAVGHLSILRWQAGIHVSLHPTWIDNIVHVRSTSESDPGLALTDAFLRELTHRLNSSLLYALRNALLMDNTIDRLVSAWGNVLVPLSHRTIVVFFTRCTLNNLAIHVAELLAITPTLYFTLGRRHWLRHLLTDHDSIDRCLALSHEIRTATSHLEGASHASSKHSRLVGGRLLWVD